ncbi:MAG: GMC oxidoreductase, partial [Spirochaetota bacterium]
LDTDATGKKITGIEIDHNGERKTVVAKTYVLATSAINSAAMLLRSANDKHPNGLANSSGLVGRGFMMHVNSGMLAVRPKTNPTIFQKTLAIHDFYGADSPAGRALGAMQLRGKVRPEMLSGNANPIVRVFGKAIAERSVDWWLMTEDLPDQDNRVSVDEAGRIHLARRSTNMSAHSELIARAKGMMHRAGFPLCLVDLRGARAIQHQCGTIRFGDNPDNSVLDQWCKAHEVNNLRVIDASFFPSAAAVNPSLTLLAQALRASERLRQKLTGA